MNANSFANHLEGYISRVLSGLELPKPDLRSHSQLKGAFRAFKMMESAIMEIKPLYRRGEGIV
jgi:hypothetical protein